MPVLDCALIALDCGRPVIDVGAIELQQAPVLPDLMFTNGFETQ